MMELKNIRHHLKEIVSGILFRFLEGLDLDWILTEEDKYIGQSVSEEKYELEVLELAGCL